MNDTNFWSATACIFGCVNLVSMQTSLECDEDKNIFKLTFACSQSGDKSRKSMVELKKNKPTVVSIKYKDISICNITQNEITLNPFEDGEYTILTTERLKSIVEIGKIKKEVNSPLYYIIFSSNYQEQLAVCKNAESIIQ